MRINVEFDLMADIMAQVEKEEGDRIRKAVKAETLALKEDLRQQVTSAGLGTRLARSWQTEIYDDDGTGLESVGVVRSKAPEIMTAFNRGVTIMPVNGAQYVWIPTKNVPRARGRVTVRGRSMKGGAMSPEEVQAQFRSRFVFKKGKAGSVLAFIDVIGAKSGMGYRPATAGRKAQGRKTMLILMFVLRKSVRLPKLLDLASAKRRAVDRLADRIERG